MVCKIKTKVLAAAAAATVMLFAVCVHAADTEKPATQGIHYIATNDSIYIFFDESMLNGVSGVKIYRQETSAGADKTSMYEKDSQTAVDAYTQGVKELKDKIAADLLGGKTLEQVEQELQDLEKTDPAAAQQRETELDALGAEYQKRLDAGMATLDAQFGNATATIAQKYCADPAKGQAGTQQPDSSSLADFTLLTATPLKNTPSVDDINKALGADAQRVFDALSVTDAAGLAALLKKDPDKLKLASILSPALAQAYGLLYIDKNVNPGAVYLYRFELIDTAGKSQTSPAMLSASVVAPVLQKIKSFIAVANNGAVLFTIDKTDDAQGWNLYRSDSTDGGFTKINQSMLASFGESVYIDSTVEAGKTYYYQAAAADIAGNEGPRTDSVQVDVPSTLPLVPPADVKAAHSGDKIVVSWTAAEEASGYNVYESTAINGTFAKMNKTVVPPGTVSYTDNDYDEGKIAYYAVSTVGKDGAESATSSAAWVIPKDMTPPPAPGKLTAAVSGTSIVLKWTPPADSSEVYGYVVYRGASADEMVKINNSAIPRDTNTFTDSLVTQDTNYYYAVSAIDMSYNPSAKSNVVQIMSADQKAPDPPVNIIAKGVDGAVDVSWVATHDVDAVGYRLYRADSENGTYTKISDLPKDATTYSDVEKGASLPNGEDYWYYITVVDDAGLESAPSHKTFGIPSDSNEPAAPANVKAAPGGGGITISWDAPAENDIKGFKVLRAVARAAVYTQVGNSLVPPDKTSFVDTTAPAGAAYWYKVVSVDTSGNESERSAATGPVGVN